jgi:hypothetical protein
MEVFPYTDMYIYVGQNIALRVQTSRALGGANQCIQEEGSIDWGDGTPFVDPFIRKDQVDDRGPHHGCKAEPVNVMTSPAHRYKQAGEYCVSATLGGSYKYEGEGSCSYDCRLNKSVMIHVAPLPEIR